MVTLVALRLGIGWHFFREGTDKIQDPSWTAAHFFTGSKGPLHPLFELLVWDVDGKVRLNYAQTAGGWPTIDLERTLSIWDQYRVRVVDHYGFDDKQQKQASACLVRWEEQLRWYFDANQDKILEYFHGLDREAANRADAAKQASGIAAWPVGADRSGTSQCRARRGWPKSASYGPVTTTRSTPLRRPSSSNAAG